MLKCIIYLEFVAYTDDKDGEDCRLFRRRIKRTMNQSPGRWLFRMFKRLSTVLLLVFLLYGLMPARAQTEKQYFALLIGQSSSGDDVYASLPGCAEDVESMADMLGEMRGTPYQISVCLKLSGSGIRDAITETFRNAREEDVCLFYYAGHGRRSNDASERGALMGADGENVPLDELCERLRAVQGQKILILDSCYAGSVIPHLVPEQSTVSGMPPIHALLATGPYAQAHSVQTVKSDESYGAFTKRLTTGSTTDKTKGYMPADRDRDGAVSMMEAYYYVRSFSGDHDSGSTPMVYPENSSCILWALEAIEP